MVHGQEKGLFRRLQTYHRDPTIQSLTANVTFTDIKKTETVSNVLTTNLQLKKLSVPVATPDLDDFDKRSRKQQSIQLILTTQ